MRLLILAATMLLTGCWVGDGLYSSSDARQPITPGIYRTIDGDEMTRVERVAVLGNEMTEIGDGDGRGFYGFAPLDKENRRFVTWYRKDEESPQDRSQFYMLLER